MVPVRTSEDPKRLKLDLECNFNQIHRDEDFMKEVSNAFMDSNINLNETRSKRAMVYQEPFRVCVLDEAMVYGEDFMTSLTDELNALAFVDKDNDLYKFKQSGDLHNETSPFIDHIRNTLETQVHTWLCQITGLHLSPSIDVFCSKYSYTDYLLCHDDQLENRRIAFNYYLSPDWSAEDGGLLDLYSTDDNGDAGVITRSITPGANMLVFFQVSPISFHQVSEVLSKTKTRLTISGWYRGDATPTDTEAYTEPPHALNPCLSVDEDEFYKWINPLYLAPSVQTDIRHKFEADSEIELVDFIQPELYEAVLEEMRSISDWAAVGPPNKRNYERCTTASHRVSECVRVLQSDAMFLTLSHLTGLALHPLYVDSDDAASDSGDKGRDAPGQTTSRCRTEVCRWSHGNYTLLHDTDTEQGVTSALDCMLYIGCQDWTPDCGGYVSYVAKGDNVELLSVQPRSNALALVYRDSGTVGFVKRLTHKTTHQHFYSLSSVYYE